MRKIRFLYVFTILFFIFSANKINASDPLNQYKLGTSYGKNQTVFRLYAPSAEAVELKVTVDGTLYSKNLNVISEINGLWQVVFDDVSSIDGAEYVFDVTVDGTIYENIIDPYAYALNEAGTRGVVIDFTYINEQIIDWEEVSHLEVPKENYFIYGLHVEDFSASDSWNGPEERRGKFLGLVQNGLYIQNQAIGFEYLALLGISHVELMPINDFYKDQYSSGFNTLAPFALARRYTNGDDYNSSIWEAKQMIRSFARESMGVILKTDFTSFSDEFKNNMSILVPNFYNNDGSINFDNNFVNKYIVDYFSFFIEEYKIDGFNLHNINSYPTELVENIANTIKGLNRESIFYGSGDYDLTKEDNFSPKNLKDINNVSLMNNSLGLGLFGKLIDPTDKGALFENFSEENIETIKFAILSSIKHKDLDYELVRDLIYKEQWIGDSTYQIINSFGDYYSLTLNDKFQLADLSMTKRRMMENLRQAYLMMFLSGGIPYIYNGDEFLHSRITDVTSVGDKVCHIGTCYFTNADGIGSKVDWGALNSNKTMFQYLKNILAIRKSNRFSLNAEIDFIKQNVDFVKGETGLFSYLVQTGFVNEHETDQIFVAVNLSDNKKDIKIPKAHKWRATYMSENNTISNDLIGVSPRGFFAGYSSVKEKVPVWVPFIVLIGVILLIYGLNLTFIKLILKRGGKIEDLNIKGKEKYMSIIGLSDIVTENKKEKTSSTVEVEEVEVVDEVIEEEVVETTLEDAETTEDKDEE